MYFIGIFIFLRYQHSSMSSSRIRFLVMHAGMRYWIFSVHTLPPQRWTQYIYPIWLMFFSPQSNLQLRQETTEQLRLRVMLKEPTALQQIFLMVEALGYWSEGRLLKAPTVAALVIPKFVGLKTNLLNDFIKWKLSWDVMSINIDILYLLSFLTGHEQQCSWCSKMFLTKM